MNLIPLLKTCWPDYSNNFFPFLDQNVHNTGRVPFRSGSDSEYSNHLLHTPLDAIFQTRQDNHARPMRRIMCHEKMILRVGDKY